MQQQKQSTCQLNSKSLRLHQYSRSTTNFSSNLTWVIKLQNKSKQQQLLQVKYLSALRAQFVKQTSERWIFSPGLIVIGGATVVLALPCPQLIALCGHSCTYIFIWMCLCVCVSVWGNMNYATCAILFRLWFSASFLICSTPLTHQSMHAVLVCVPVCICVWR